MGNEYLNDKDLDNECFMCNENAKNGISPCACMTKVHPECLEKWVNYQPKEDTSLKGKKGKKGKNGKEEIEDRMICKVCHERYATKKTIVYDKDFRNNLSNNLKKNISHKNNNEINNIMFHVFCIFIILILVAFAIIISVGFDYSYRSDDLWKRHTTTRINYRGEYSVCNKSICKYYRWSFVIGIFIFANFVIMYPMQIFFYLEDKQENRYKLRNQNKIEEDSNPYLTIYKFLIIFIILLGIFQGVANLVLVFLFKDDHLFNIFSIAFGITQLILGTIILSIASCIFFAICLFICSIFYWIGMYIMYIFNAIKNTRKESEKFVFTNA